MSIAYLIIVRLNLKNPQSSYKNNGIGRSCNTLRPTWTTPPKKNPKNKNNTKPKEKKKTKNKNNKQKQQKGILEANIKSIRLMSLIFIFNNWWIK